MEKAVAAGKLDAGDAAAARNRIVVDTDLDALAEVELCVEAATEDEALKVELFGRLDRVLARDDVILASNTSSVPIMKLGSVTRRPERVIGLHFVNPVPAGAPLPGVPAVVAPRSDRTGTLE